MRMGWGCWRGGGREEGGREGGRTVVYNTSRQNDNQSIFKKRQDASSVVYFSFFY